MCCFLCAPGGGLWSGRGRTLPFLLRPLRLLTPTGPLVSRLECGFRVSKWGDNPKEPGEMGDMSQQWYYSKGGQRQGPGYRRETKGSGGLRQIAPTDLVGRGTAWANGRKLGLSKGSFRPPQRRPFKERLLLPQLPLRLKSKGRLVLSDLWQGGEREGSSMSRLRRATSCWHPILSILRGTNPSRCLRLREMWSSSLQEGRARSRRSAFCDPRPLSPQAFSCAFPWGTISFGRNPHGHAEEKIIWSGAWLVFVFLITAHTARQETEARRIVAEANKSWSTGNKAEAVSQYRTVIDKGIGLVEASDRSLILSRVVDYEVESGQTDEAEETIRRCSGDDVLPETTAGKALVAQVKEELQQEAAKRRRRRPRKGG